MEHNSLSGKSREELLTNFYLIAEKVGLIKSGFYIDGIPKGNETDINDFYILEDWLEYPEPSSIYKIKLF